MCQPPSSDNCVVSHPLTAPQRCLKLLTSHKLLSIPQSPLNDYRLVSRRILDLALIFEDCLPYTGLISRACSGLLVKHQSKIESFRVGNVTICRNPVAIVTFDDSIRVDVGLKSPVI